jgi:DNA polymerase III epsilon subunit-like protein
VHVVDAFAAFLERHRSVELISRKGSPYRVTRVGGHNVSGFDLDRMKRLFSAYGKFLPVHFAGVLDTLPGIVWYFERRARLRGLSSMPKNFKLSSVAEYFEIETPAAHDALGDVYTSIEVARRILMLDHEEPGT